jgi:hypothetical protein
MRNTYKEILYFQIVWSSGCKCPLLSLCFKFVNGVMGCEQEFRNITKVYCYFVGKSW